MNQRILELLVSPETITETDLSPLEKEIQTYPYVQSIRALHLYGTYLFKKEDFQKVLSETAAYTTDKKILYQLINKNQVKTEPVPFREPVTEEKKTETLPVSEAAKEEQIPDSEIQNTASCKVRVAHKPVYINDEKNRILFKGEEDFMNTSTEEIPLKSDTEKIPTSEEKTESASYENKISEEAVSGNSGETVLKEETSAELSFQAMDAFLPEVKIEKKSAGYNIISPVKASSSKHEDEMKKLIEMVETQMKTNKKQRKEEPENDVQAGSEINFAESYDSVPEKKEEPVSVSEPENPAVSEISEEKTIEEQREWKPISFEPNIPDALLAKKTEPQPVSPEPLQEQEPKSEEHKTETAEERPVINVSFFSSKSEILPADIVEETAEEQQNSNVPDFINTWQSWLKIDRSEQKKEEPLSIEEIKSRAIDKFIETEPKISQLREDAAYAVKEKSSDISHLMTETLAKLYVEQKLYSKAINAYKVLIEKHPEKTEVFTEKIEEIKQLRAGK